MATNVDVVVVGAGINGASIAYNLAKRGCKNIAIVERFTLASGGTGKSAAIVRQHYSNDVLIRMAKRSRDIFEFFADEIGGSAGFVKTGYLFFVPDYVKDAFDANITLQQKIGVKTSSISRRNLGKSPRRLTLVTLAVSRMSRIRDTQTLMRQRFPICGPPRRWERVFTRAVPCGVSTFKTVRFDA